MRCAQPFRVLARGLKRKNLSEISQRLQTPEILLNPKTLAQNPDKCSCSQAVAFNIWNALDHLKDKRRSLWLLALCKRNACGSIALGDSCNSCCGGHVDRSAMTVKQVENGRAGPG